MRCPAVAGVFVLAVVSAHAALAAWLHTLAPGCLAAHACPGCKYTLPWLLFLHTAVRRPARASEPSRSDAARLPQRGSCLRNAPVALTTKAFDQRHARAARSRGPSQEADGKTVFVRGFDRMLDENDVRNELINRMSEFGEVTEVRLPVDFNTGGLKGFGYVVFAEAAGGPVRFAPSFSAPRLLFAALRACAAACSASLLALRLRFVAVRS